MSPPTSPLKARDVNTSVASSSKQASKVAPEDQKPKSMEYHRQILQSRLEEDKDKSKYISPSDMIMSPATKKLEALKGKRFGKAKGQSLFANTMSKNVTTSIGDAEVGKSTEGGENQ